MDTLAKQIEVQGKQIVCAHCGGKYFSRRGAQLNTAFMTFLDLDCYNKTAKVFVCSDCGHLEWFLDPKITAQDDMREQTECLSCGGIITANQNRCSKCGWTYKE